MTYTIGMYNKNFQMNSQEILEERVEPVRGRDSLFKIVAGPLLWDGKPLKKTYVLEVHYKDSEDAHAQTLPLGGWNSCLCDDYMNVSTDLAKQFCEQNGFVISQILNSWPEYQAIVCKQPKQ